MPRPKVLEFKVTDPNSPDYGKVSGRVGPRFFTPLQVAFAMYEAGFRYEFLPTGLAIFKAESLLSPDAEGDLLRVDDEWGPSYNISQIRSRHDELGKGTERDAERIQGVKGMNTALRIARKWAEADGWGRWGAYTHPREKPAYLNNMEMAERVCSYMGVRIK